MSDDVTVLVGWWGGNPLPGSKRMPCTKCGKLVWCSPTSQAILRTRPEVTLLCLPCSNPDGEEVEYQMTREQVAEVLNHRRRN